MIEEYEKLLRESGGTTMGHEGYGIAYNATEGNEEESSLAESIVKYAERATSAERTVADLEGRLAVLEMGNTMAPPPQAAYFLPQQPTFQFPPQQPPANIHIPQPPTGWGQPQGASVTTTVAHTEERSQGTVVGAAEEVTHTTMMPTCAPSRHTATR
eukprot:scaffold52003_cov26-Attheya_sp.AAC.1